MVHIEKKKKSTGALLFVVPILLTFTIIYFFVLKPGINYDNLIETGRRTKAVILKIADGNSRSNTRYTYKLDLLVDAHTVNSYHVMEEQYFSTFEISRIKKGDTVEVCVDKKDKMNVVVNIEALK